MFGDPVSNPYGYDKVALSDLADIKIGPFGSLLHKEDYIDGGHPLLNPSHIVDGKVSPDDKLTISDEKYEELYNVVDPNLSSYDKLLFLNHELFYMIETSIDVSLVAYLYSAQLVTKDKRSLSDHKRFYYVWLSEIIQNALDSGEFAPTSSAKDLMDIYAMFERALLYDWSIVKGKFSLTEKSDALLPHVLDAFVNGL